jgi:hypothetical protein
LAVIELYLQYKAERKMNNEELAITKLKQEIHTILPPQCLKALLSMLTQTAALPAF